MRILWRISIALWMVIPKEATSWSWTHQGKDAQGPHVSGHTASATPEKVLLFGGLTGSAGSPVTDELWSYSVKDQRWNQLIKGKGPGPRMYAASAILDGYFYLFGGWDPGEKGSGGTFQDDVWRLDLDTHDWTLQKERMPCGSISRHSACRVGSVIVINTFRGILVYNGNDGSSFVQQPTQGDDPEGLSMCVTVPLGKRSMLLFGGSTKTQQLSNDVFVLDTDNWSWRKLIPSKEGSGPPPLASPCAAAVDENSCIIFGGASIGSGGYEGGAGLIAQDDTWLLTVKGDKAEWENVGIKGPEGRVAATLSPLSSGGFLLQGGWNPATKETYDEPWLLER